ncbi:MAG: YdcF family protein [Tindallia sp. MSAO_Bac2]|nr:MAG: YdcF family protein [Tindallia sp. MSAO_Bac2]
MKSVIWKIGAGIILLGFLQIIIQHGTRFESLGLIILGLSMVSYHLADNMFKKRLIFLHKYPYINKLMMVKVWLFIFVGSVFILVQAMIMVTILTADDGGADYAVVLGAGIIRREPSYTLARRLDSAVDFLNAYPDRHVVVSGGRSEGQLASEAQVMKWYLEGQKVPSEQILKEEESTNTLENIRNSVEALEKHKGINVEKIVIITSDYHMFRAQLIGRRIGVETHGITASSPTSLYWYYAMREFAAIFKSMISDW